MQGGPTCEYNGKTVPCFVGSSPNASITSQLLADMLKFMDDLQLFHRDDGHLPFILLDGHPSRLQKAFQDYVNNPIHRWSVCIGVPYATHIWQVNDSSELNGAFKMMLSKAKRDLFLIKHAQGTTMGPTDIMPLVRKAWDASFGRPCYAKKAIADRGWGPLNYILLQHKMFQRSIDLQESEEDAVSIPSHPTVMNVDGVSAYHFHQLLKQMLRDEGVMRAYNNPEAAIQERQATQEQLGQSFKLTAGSITRKGVFCVLEQQHCGEATACWFLSHLITKSKKVLNVFRYIGLRAATRFLTFQYLAKK
jgi:hypothetical protein